MGPDYRVEPVLRSAVRRWRLAGIRRALGLYLRAEHEALAFCDPATGLPILTYEDQPARADAEVARRREQLRQQQQPP